jgi:hypothetical protein
VSRDGTGARLSRDEALQFPAPEEQVERHADVRDEHDDEQPGHGVAGLPLFAHEARDQKDREQEAHNGQQVAQNLAVDRVLRRHDRSMKESVPAGKAKVRWSRKILHCRCGGDAGG